MNEERIFAAIIGLAQKANISPEEFADMAWGSGAITNNGAYLERVISRLEQLKNLNSGLKTIQL